MSGSTSRQNVRTHINIVGVLSAHDQEKSTRITRSTSWLELNERVLENSWGVVADSFVSEANIKYLVFSNAAVHERHRLPPAAIKSFQNIT